MGRQEHLEEAYELLKDADPRWVESILQMSRTACGKGKDYGNEEDNLANLTACKSMGIEPWVGTTIRMRDKEKRIDSFLTKGELHNESLEDAIEDAAVYAVHRLSLYREAQEGEDIVDGEIVVPPIPWERGMYLASQQYISCDAFEKWRCKQEYAPEAGSSLDSDVDAEYWWPRWHEAGCP